jgi:hypothetical protein
MIVRKLKIAAFKLAVLRGRDVARDGLAHGERKARRPDALLSDDHS